MLSRRMPSRAARRTALVAALAVTGAAGGASTAAAHDSYFTGHYTLSGEHWQLVYKGPYDTRGYCGPYNDPGSLHYHYVNHNYRTVANSGPFYYYHQRLHYVSCQIGTPIRRAMARASAVDAGVTPATARGRAELCLRFRLYCAADRPGRSAASAVSELRTELPVRVLRLRAAPTRANPSQHLADRVAEPVAEDCVVGILDARGVGPAQAGALGGGVTVEVASPATAKRLRHRC